MSLKVLVVCDKQGKIISLGRPADMSERPSDIPSVEVEPKSGQFVYYIELPAELDKTHLLDLHNSFRVDMKAEPPRFVRAQDSTEPRRKQ